jgi:peptide/nickel transport system permease protein
MATAGVAVLNMATLLRNTFRTRATRVACVLFLVIVAVGVLANFFSPQSPYSQDTSHLLAGPSWEHLLGTDYLGRDTLSRIILGTRVSLVGALEAVAVGVVGGVLPGLVSVFVSNWLQFLIMRLIDGLMTIPAIVFAIGVVAVLGETQVVAMGAIGVLFVPAFFRITRAATLGYANTQYVDAARLLGATTPWVIRKHIFSKVAPTIFVTAASAMAGGILAVSSLAFLGIGAQPPIPSWGAMLSADMNYLSINGYSAIFPGIAIVLTVGSLGIIADGIRDAMGAGAVHDLVHDQAAGETYEAAGAAPSVQRVA